MQRDPKALAREEYDVLIIGGGAFGAAAAREAALLGIRTALIERSDFGAGASAECFKMVHGGIRYLQHADLPRLRSSARERSAFLRIAPHLVHPLPIAIPTFGHGRGGRAFLGAGASVYDLLTYDRNAGIADPMRRINRTRFLSSHELRASFPHLASPDLTGAVIFEDGQMYNPARLVLGFVKAAHAGGADVCNYLSAQDFLWEGSRVCGVRAQDQLSGESFDIRARFTLNAAGPWADYLHMDQQRFGGHRRLPFSRDAYFIVDRKPSSPYGLAVQGLSRDADAVLSRANRHLFAVPWRDRTLFGVWHRHFPETPDKAQVEHDELVSWITELNTVYPALQLTLDEVSFANCGLVPFGETATEHELSFGKESRLIDHREAHGVGGLVSLVGIRFTTARADARRALELLLRQWPQGPSVARTHDRSLQSPLPGGEIEDFSRFRREAERTAPKTIDKESLEGLLRNFGTEHKAIIATGEQRLVPGTDTLLSEVDYAVTTELAARLDDVVMRRTNLAAGRHPGSLALQFVADRMGKLLGWSAAKTAEELHLAQDNLHKHRARESTRSAVTHGAHRNKERVSA